MKTETELIENKTKDVVLALINAINNEDFKTARTYVTNDMKFIGVLGSRDSADAYFSDMEKMKLKYDVKKWFTDGNDACVFYELEIEGKKIFCCGWYHLKNEKVNSLRVIFDPREVIGSSPKKN